MHSTLQKLYNIEKDLLSISSKGELFFAVGLIISDVLHEYEDGIKYQQRGLRGIISELYSNHALSSEEKESLAEPYRLELENLEKHLIECRQASK